MCEALSVHFEEVRLYAREGKGGQSAAETAFGFPFSFELRTVRQRTRIPGGGYRMAARIFAQEMFGAADVFYGRHPHSLLALSYFGRPFAYEAHTLPVPGPARAVLQRLLSRANCVGLVCISDALAHAIKTEFAPDAPVHVLRDAARPAEENVVAAGKWPGRPDALQVGYVGHLYPGKGMEVVGRLAAEMPDVDFHVIGGRPEDIDQWQSKGEWRNLQFHGYVPPVEVPGHIARLDVVLLPNQQEVWAADGRVEIGQWTSPLKAFEYMAHAKAIVASDIPALREIFRNGETAVFAPPDEVGAWCSAIRGLMDERLRSDLGKRAQQDFLGHYTWEHRAEAVAALFKD